MVFTSHKTSIPTPLKLCDDLLISVVSFVITNIATASDLQSEQRPLICRVKQGVALEVLAHYAGLAITSNTQKLTEFLFPSCQFLCGNKLCHFCFLGFSSSTKRVEFIPLYQWCCERQVGRAIMPGDRPSRLGWEGKIKGCSCHVSVVLLLKPLLPPRNRVGENALVPAPAPWTKDEGLANLMAREWHSL